MPNQSLMLNQRVFAAMNYHYCGGSPSSLYTLHEKKYEKQCAPTRQTVTNLIAKFTETGSVVNHKENLTERTWSVRTDENIQEIEDD